MSATVMIVVFGGLITLSTLGTVTALGFFVGGVVMRVRESSPVPAPAPVRVPQQAVRPASVRDPRNAHA